MTIDTATIASANGLVSVDCVARKVEIQAVVGGETLTLTVERTYPAAPGLVSYDAKAQDGTYRGVYGVDGVYVSSSAWHDAMEGALQPKASTPAARSLAQIEAAAEAANPRTLVEPKMAQFGAGRLKGEAKDAYLEARRAWDAAEEARREAVSALRDRLWADEAPLRDSEWAGSAYGRHEAEFDAKRESA